MVEDEKSQPIGAHICPYCHEWAGAKGHICRPKLTAGIKLAEPRDDHSLPRS